MQRHFDDLMKNILAPQTYVPMMRAADGRQGGADRAGPRFGRIYEKSPEEIVCERFENEHVRTLMLYMACHWGWTTRSPASATWCPSISTGWRTIGLRLGAHTAFRTSCSSRPSSRADKSGPVPDQAHHRRERHSQGRGARGRHPFSREQGGGQHHRQLIRRFSSTSAKTSWSRNSSR